MAETITQQLLRQSLDLSYAEIEKEHPEWSKRAIDDYFYKQSNINTLAISNEGVEAQVILNTAAITVNANNLTDHINDTVGAHAASAISFINTVSGLTAIEVQAAIDELDGIADTNAANISTNTTNISTNATNITSITNAFNTHNGSNSQHGVTGNNVGTEDFAQTALGGVVFLADLVNNAVASTASVTSADATDLATVITLANELKADVNQLVTDFNNSVTQLNDIIQQMKDAKQMSLT